MGLRRPGEVRKVGGQLQQVSSETAAQLGQEVGAPTPVSPMLGAGLGASPDSAKMLGTPANMRAAIRARTGTEGEQLTKQRAERTQDFATQISDEQKQKKAEYDRWIGAIPGLGKLDELMAKKVVDSLKPGANVGTQKLGVDWESVVSYVGRDSDATAKLQEIAQDTFGEDGTTITQASLLTKLLQGDALSLAEREKIENTFTELNEMGYDISVDTIRQNFIKSPEDQLAEQILESRATEIRIGDLQQEDLNKLGLTESYLGQLFGDPTNAKRATYADVKMRIAELQSSFADVRELERLASDPFTSPTQRREANKRLRELGFLGKRAAMEKVGDLEKQIEDGDTIKIGDAVFEIEDVLEDEDFMEVIRDAMGDERQMRAIAKTNPDLAKWLTENKQGLDAQLQRMTGRLPAGTKAKDLFRVTPDQAKEYWEGEFDEDAWEQALAAFPELTAGDTTTLTAAQTQQVIAKAQTIAADARTRAISSAVLSGVPEDVAQSIYEKATAGVGVAGEQAAMDAAVSTWQRDTFDASPYKKAMDEIQGIYKALGIADPNTYLSAADYAKASPAERDKMLDAALATARTAQTTKQTKDTNTTSLAPYRTAGLDNESLNLLLSPATLADVEAGKVPFAKTELFNRFDRWVGAAKKGDESLYRNAFVSALKAKDPNITSLFESEIGPIASRNRNILLALGKGPAAVKAVFAELNKGRAEVARYNKALTDFNKAPKKLADEAKKPQLWEAVFQDKGTASAFAELYAKYSSTKLLGNDKKSKLPAALDSNGDGLIDSPQAVIERLRNDTAGKAAAGNFLTQGNKDAKQNNNVDTNALTALRTSLAATASNVVNGMATQKEQNDADKTWKESGFGQTYASLFNNKYTGFKEKDILGALGLSRMTALDFHRMGPDARKAIEKQVKTIADRQKQWESGKGGKYTPIAGTQHHSIYKELYGAVPSAADFVLKGLGDVATIRKQYEAADAAVKIQNALPNIFPNTKGDALVRMKERYLEQTKLIIAGKNSTHGSVTSYLQALQNRPADTRVVVTPGKAATGGRGSSGPTYGISEHTTWTWESDPGRWVPKKERRQDVAPPRPRPPKR